VSQFFTLEGPAGLPMYGTDDGGKAVLLFSTRDDAECFSAMRGMPSEIRAIQFASPEKFLDWLKKARDDGATRYCMNPSPDDSLSVVGHQSIDQMIALVEALLG
jgi:hypothetical protein